MFPTAFRTKWSLDWLVKLQTGYFRLALDEKQPLLEINQENYQLAESVAAIDTLFTTSVVAKKITFLSYPGNVLSQFLILNLAAANEQLLQTRRGFSLPVETELVIIPSLCVRTGGQNKPPG